jgi:SAM-dependent methyltransferase
MDDMYSSEWFATFAATVPAELTAADVDGIAAIVPVDRYPRLLDVGCGIGRVAAPLAARGYAVTGIDVNVDALIRAARSAPGPRDIALDQRHIGRLHWQFDAAVLLWNSLGFAGRGADLETVSGVAAVLRPGGTVIFDLYHPEWLGRNERAGETDSRGASVRRWMRDRRCFHEIRYASGRVDDIQFDVYAPAEIADLARRAGLVPDTEMVRWNPKERPSADAPRYQFACSRR